jgi:molybdopterin converting factor small subunit
MTKIRIPTPLRLYTEGQSSVSVSGTTVGEALSDLTQKYPDLQQHLYDGEKLRSFVNVFLNSEDVRHIHGEKTAVTPNDTLMIIPSIAGGRPRIEEESL